MKKISTPIIKDRHKRLLSLVKDNWFRLLFAMGCMLIVAASTAASAFLVKPVLDDIFFNKDIKMLKLIPVAVIIIYFLRGIGYYGYEYLMNYVGQSIIRRLETIFMAIFMTFRFRFFIWKRRVSLCRALPMTSISSSLWFLRRLQGNYRRFDNRNFFYGCCAHAV